MKCSLGISNFLGEISKSFPFYCSPLFFCIFHLECFISSCYSLEFCIQFGVFFPFPFAFLFSPRRPSYLSLLFFANLHSFGSIFPFPPFLFFPNLPISSSIFMIKNIYILAVTYQEVEIHRVPASRKWSKDSLYFLLLFYFYFFEHKGS